MGIIDTHAHVTYHRLANRIDEIVKNALEHNVTRVLIVCCNIEEAEKALEVCEQYEMFDMAFGYHPEDADMNYNIDFTELSRTIKE